MKRLASILLLLCATKAQAAQTFCQATGHLSRALSTSYTNMVLTFTPQSTPLIDNPLLVSGATVTTTSRAPIGYFEINLEHGIYRVQIGGLPRDVFTITIPPDTLETNHISHYITAGATTNFVPGDVTGWTKTQADSRYVKITNGVAVRPVLSNNTATVGWVWTATNAQGAGHWAVGGGGSGTPAGAEGMIQANLSSAFGAHSNMFYHGANGLTRFTNNIGVGQVVISTPLKVDGQQTNTQGLVVEGNVDFQGIVSVSDLTPTRVAIINGLTRLDVSTVTPNELATLSGIDTASGIETRLNTKVETNHNTALGTNFISHVSDIGAPASDDRLPILDVSTATRKYVTAAQLVAAGGAGTVTHTTGALTVDLPVLGNGSDDIKSSSVANFLSILSVPTHAQLVTASNTLNTALVANDTTTSNGLVTILRGNDIITSNALVTLLVANDTVTSNGVVAFVMTTSNTLATAYIANDTTTSNGLISILNTKVDTNAASALGTNWITHVEDIGTPAAGDLVPIVDVSAAKRKYVLFSALTGTAAAGGADTQMQYNNAGSLDGAAKIIQSGESNLFVSGSVNSRESTVTNSLTVVSTPGVEPSQLFLYETNGVKFQAIASLYTNHNSVTNIIAMHTNGVAGGYIGISSVDAAGTGIIWTNFGVPALHSQLLSASNALQSAFVANDTTTSNALRTLLIANDTTTSNGLVTLLVANDTTTSNALISLLNTKVETNFNTALGTNFISHVANIGTPDSADLLPILDVSVAERKYVTVASIVGAGANGPGMLDFSQNQFTTNAIVHLKPGLPLTNAVSWLDANSLASNSVANMHQAGAAGAAYTPWELYDNFERANTAWGVITPAPTGHIWETNAENAQLAHITNGYAFVRQDLGANPGSVRFMTKLQSTPSEVGAKLSWQQSTGTVFGSCTIAISPEPFGSGSGFTLSKVFHLYTDREAIVLDVADAWPTSENVIAEFLTNIFPTNAALVDIQHTLNIRFLGGGWASISFGNFSTNVWHRWIEAARGTNVYWQLSASAGSPSTESLTRLHSVWAGSPPNAAIRENFVSLGNLTNATIPWGKYKYVTWSPSNNAATFNFTGGTNVGIPMETKLSLVLTGSATTAVFPWKGPNSENVQLVAAPSTNLVDIVYDGSKTYVLAPGVRGTNNGDYGVSGAIRSTSANVSGIATNANLRVTGTINTEDLAANGNLDVAGTARILSTSFLGGNLWVTNHAFLSQMFSTNNGVGAASIGNAISNVAFTAGYGLLVSGTSNATHNGTITFALPSTKTNTFWVDAGALKPTHGSTSDGGRVGATAWGITNGISAWDVFQFGAATNSTAQFKFGAEQGFSGLLYFDIHLYATGAIAATTCTSLWEIAVAPYGTNNHLGNWPYRTNLIQKFVMSNALTIVSMPLITLTNYLDRNVIDVSISRLGTNTTISDSIASDIFVSGVKVSYTTTNAHGRF